MGPDDRERKVGSPTWQMTKGNGKPEDALVKVLEQVEDICNANKT